MNNDDQLNAIAQMFAELNGRLDKIVSAVGSLAQTQTEMMATMTTKSDIEDLKQIINTHDRQLDDHEDRLHQLDKKPPLWRRRAA